LLGAKNRANLFHLCENIVRSIHSKKLYLYKNKSVFMSNENILNSIRQKDRFSAFAYPFVELGWNYGAYFSPKIYTNSEWQQRKGTPFYVNVNKDGIVLC